MNSSTKLIDFARYDRFARQQLSELHAWVLADQSGRLIYATCPEESARALIGEAGARPGEGPASERRWSGEIPISACNNVFSGRLHYLLERRSDGGEAIMQMIADCIGNDLALHCELDAMADELAERYEELHLIYDTEDKAASFQEGQQALAELVDNCLGYLGVDAALLWLPTQKITVLQHSAELPLESQLSLDLNVKEAILGAVQREAAALVVNGLAERPDLELARLLPCKLLAVPVSSNQQTCLGVLVLLNGLQKKDFSNSDRALIEAMARKVSKLIHAHYDELTGLIRRTGFEHYLRQALAASRYQGHSHTVLCVNLDKFSVINDTLGAAVGDQLLQTVAAVCQREIRDSDSLARLDGDTFGLLLSNCPQGQARVIAERILAALRQLRVGQSGQEFNVTASIGLGTLGADGRGLEPLLVGLDVALRLAKEQGGDRLRCIGSGDSELQSRASAMQWIARLQGAVRHDNFELLLQPIVPCRSLGQSAAHGEFLLRYRRDDGTLVSPEHFMPAAEHYHLMPSLDRWVVRRALAHIAGFSAAGCWSINLSGQSLVEEGFDQELVRLIGDSGVDPTQLCFEITETSAIGNLARAQQLIGKLRQIGCRFALDDFGTGLSSFTYLRELEVDFVKIDGSFVRQIAEDPVALAIVRAVQQVAEGMGLETIAEYVENEAIRRHLLEIGVDYAQGYYFGRPEPLPRQR